MLLKIHLKRTTSQEVSIKIRKTRVNICFRVLIFAILVLLIYYLFVLFLRFRKYYVLRKRTSMQVLITLSLRLFNPISQVQGRGGNNNPKVVFLK